MKWFYSKRDNIRERGLVDERTLRKLVKQKRVLSDDLVWPLSKDTGWLPAGSIEGLFPARHGRPAWLVLPLPALVGIGLLAIGLLGWGAWHALQSPEHASPVVEQPVVVEPSPPEPTPEPPTEPVPDVSQAALASQAVARVQSALADYKPAAARALLGEVVSLLGTNDVVAVLLTRTRQQERESQHLVGLREALKTGALPRQRVKELLAFAERYANRDELVADVLVLLDRPGGLSLAQCLNGFWAAEALGKERLMARAVAAASLVLPTGTAAVPIVQVTTACRAANLRGEAFKLLNALTVASPESPEAWLEFAAWQCERGEEKEALRSVRQATKLGGDDIKKKAREDSRFAPVSDTWSFRWNTG